MEVTCAHKMPNGRRCKRPPKVVGGVSFRYCDKHLKEWVSGRSKDFVKFVAGRIANKGLDYVIENLPALFQEGRGPTIMSKAKPGPVSRRRGPTPRMQGRASPRATARGAKIRK